MNRSRFLALSFLLSVLGGCGETPAGKPPLVSIDAELGRAQAPVPPARRKLPSACDPGTEPEAQGPYEIWREPLGPRFETGNPRAEPVSPLVGEYTSLAREARVSGIVILEVAVSAEGAPLGARVLKGLPCGLEAKAKEAVRQAQFRPGLIHGRPADSMTLVSVKFQWTGNR